MLRDAEIGLFRADDRVFDAMLDGWRAQMLARGLTTQTIDNRCRILRRFQEYSGEFPWTWRPVDLDDYMAERRSGEKAIRLTTLRSDSNAIAMFCAYASSSSYGWGAFCEQTFGDVPAQIAFDWNTPRHTTDDAMPPGRRAFTQKEVQKLFDYMDDLVDREYAAGSKRWLPALRDSIAFRVCATPTAFAAVRWRCSTCTTSAPTPTCPPTASSVRSRSGGPRAPLGRAPDGAQS